MKKAFDILTFICALTILSCSDNADRYKNFTLPDKSECSEIIRAILKQDTSFINRGLLQSDYVAADLIKLPIKFGKLTPDTITSKSIVTPPDNYSGPCTSLRELYYFHVTDSINLGKDSVYFAFLNDSTKQIVIDSNIVDFVKFANAEIKNKIKGEQYSGYFQFTLPILNKAANKAFVTSSFICSGLCGEGMLYILEKINNKWTLKLAKTIWVS